MDEGVIISSIMSRIEYYINASGISNAVEKQYIKKETSTLEDKLTQPLLLYVKRLLQSFNIAMGEKRTTIKMYLERDLKYLEDIEKKAFSSDKNQGRNFVNTMRQNPVTNNFSANEVNDNGMNNAKSKTLTKIDSTSNAYKMYNNNIKII